MVEIYGEFTEQYGRRVLVKESGSVEPRCWIFTYPNDVLLRESDPLLTPQQAEHLIAALQKFIEAARG